VLGLIVAATAQVHSVFVPTSYSGVVTSVDIFRILFYAILFVGVAEGARGDLRTLRRANEEMRELRDAEVRAAGIQERARLAREVHDGLIQDLWLARLKSGHLRGVEGMPEDGQILADQLDRALDGALGDARQALASLTDTEARAASLSGSLPRLVDEMAERIEPELLAKVEAELPALPRKVELEILAIVREAIVNAEKHADASLIRVEARHENDVLLIEVADNGIGFDSSASMGGYGLRSMRERAELIGATIRIASRMQDGTSILIQVPVAGARATAGAAAARGGGGGERPAPVAVPPRAAG
jgi:NarL family two-component system sensor histidine kinase LiaS